MEDHDLRSMNEQSYSQQRAEAFISALPVGNTSSSPEHLIMALCYLKPTKVSHSTWNMLQTPCCSQQSLLIWLPHSSPTQSLSQSLLLVLKYPKFLPASRPLHLLFLLPRMLFPHILSLPASPHHAPLLGALCHFFRMVLLDHCS